MKTTILSQKETQLQAGSRTRIDVPNYVRIDCIQLVISCGDNMFKKSIRVWMYGPEGEVFNIDKIDLDIKHHLLVDTDIELVKDIDWPVKYIEIEPLQKDNWPIYFGVDSLNLP